MIGPIGAAGLTVSRVGELTTTRNKRTRRDTRYRQVAQDLLAAMDGENPVYPVGSYLPTKKELREIYKVSPATLDNAFDLLLQMGRIDPKPGRGTRVLAPPPEDGAGQAGGDEELLALVLELRTRVETLAGAVNRQGDRIALLERELAARRAQDPPAPAS